MRNMTKAAVLFMVLFGAVLAQAQQNMPTRLVLTPVEVLSTSWMQEFYNKSLNAKQQTNPIGLCAEAHRTYAIDTDDQEGLVTSLEAVKHTVSEILDKKQDKEAQLLIIAGGPVKADNSSDIERYVERALPGSGLSEELLSHANEFGSGKKVFLHIDALYGRKKTDAHPVQQDFLRVIVVIDLEKKEMFFAGTGDCDF